METKRPGRNKELARLSAQRYRDRHPERLKASRRKAWAKKRKTLIFKDKRCPICEVLLASPSGAERTKKYCRSCWDNQQEAIKARIYELAKARKQGLLTNQPSC